MVDKDLKDAAKKTWWLGLGGILGGYLANKVSRKVGLNKFIVKQNEKSIECVNRDIKKSEEELKILEDKKDKTKKDLKNITWWKKHITFQRKCIEEYKKDIKFNS